jgi:hypothetical protein
LGSAIDIGTAMTRKILKQNGSVMYRSSVRPLTQDEIQSPTEQKERQEFDMAIGEKFGPAMNKDDFQNDPDYAYFATPTYDCSSRNKMMFDIEGIQYNLMEGIIDHRTDGHAVAPAEIVKLLPLPQPPLRARMDAWTNPSAQRATQLRSVLARVNAVARQKQITTDVP